MKRTVLLSALMLAACLKVHGQVLIINDNIFQQRMSEISTTVLDSLTNEPLAFASVYVIPAKDSVITNFILSDAKGEAKLEEVPFGNYVFKVEMLGYKPFVRERYFREPQVDMGTIRLKPDEQFLNAALVSDVGNPIVVKKDTIEFNASSFRVGSNAMLRDLLQRMPGMEITENGKVKFNGEEIDKLTVGGRTFFFNDQSAALNNLPASIVDKIRVIDRESESARATGISDSEREKVLDVALKKEYEKDWFGNAGLKGGSTAWSADPDNPLKNERGLLYNGNLLASAYSEKDQLTFIANAQNINDSDVVIVTVDSDGNYSSSDSGLTSAAQVGLNANTSRIKDVETTVSANYKYSDTEIGSMAARTTWQDDGKLFALSEDAGRRYSDSFHLGAELQKEQGNVWFHIEPSFSYGRTSESKSSRSNTSTEGIFVNNSENASHSQSERMSSELNASVTFRNLFGRSGRSLQVRADGEFSTDSGKSDEYTRTIFSDTEDSRNMSYVNDGSFAYFSGGLRYTEPIGEKWTLNTMASLASNRRISVRDAFDDAGHNDYYSSETRQDYFKQEYSLGAQYKFGKGSLVMLGGTVTGALNEVRAKNFGIETLTGEDEWSWAAGPTIRFEHSSGHDRISLSTYSRNQRPQTNNIQPVMNIGNPTYLKIGNVHLSASNNIGFNGMWTRNNKERFSTLLAYMYGSIVTTPTAFASWYDANGVQYSVPVNTDRPSVSGSLQINYTTPLDEAKAWTLSARASGGLSSSASYLPKGTLPGLDKDHFDYFAFMQDFWGDGTGDRFFSGESGFLKQITSSFSPGLNGSIKYNRNSLSLGASAGTTWGLYRYSANPSADMNTSQSEVKLRGSYTTGNEYEINSDISYVCYSGFANGFGTPEWRWNAEISKNIGPFNLSLKAFDILNQTKGLSHSVNANYEEDRSKLVMGRYIMLGVKWNFGKMNAAHSSNAQNAVWRMLW